MTLNNDKINLAVQGMTCMHCANTVKKAVESVEGISGVIVDLDKNQVQFDSPKPDAIDEVKKQIKLAGYEA